MLVEIACVVSVIFWGKLDHSVSLESIGSCCAERRERLNQIKSDCWCDVGVF